MWCFSCLAGSNNLILEPSAVELETACKQLQSAKNLKNEWALDFKQANENRADVIKIETAFEPYEACQEKSNSFHQSMVRTESHLAREFGSSEKELELFSTEGLKCKSREKAERLKLVLDKMNSRITEFQGVTDQAAELHKRQVALSEGLEGIRKLPPEIDPKVEQMREHLKNALRAKQALEKKFGEVVVLEKKYQKERTALIEKYKNNKAKLPDDRSCDVRKAEEWLKEAESLTTSMKDMIEKSIALKPKLNVTLQCKPVVDSALLEKSYEYPKNLRANVESRRGPLVIERCLATAGFYDEVAKSVQWGEEAEKNRRRMKEKEEDDTRRASAVPTLRRQKEEKAAPRGLASVAEEERR